MTFKPGTKVTHDYLGNGEVVRSLEKYAINGWLIQFDKDPPYEYNMNLNPTFIFKNELKLKEVKK